MSDPISITIKPGQQFPLLDVQPFNATVPWLYDGTLEFIAEEGLTFQGQGITFAQHDPPAPYTWISTTPTLVTYAAVNDDPAETGIPFPYVISLNEEFTPFEEDPTVENEPPPPPAD